METRTFKVEYGQGTLLECEKELFGDHHDCDDVTMMEPQSYAAPGMSYQQHAGDTYDCLHDALEAALDKDRNTQNEPVEVLVRPSFPNHPWVWYRYIPM